MFWFFLRVSLLTILRVSSSLFECLLVVELNTERRQNLGAARRTESEDRDKDSAVEAH
jgi:hypothetical protein